MQQNKTFPAVSNPQTLKEAPLFKHYWTLDESKLNYSSNFSKTVTLNGEDLALTFELKSKLDVINSSTFGQSPQGFSSDETSPFTFGRSVTSTNKTCFISCELELKEIISTSKTALVGDLTKIYEETDDLPFSDVMLLCGQDSFPCHKFILATRSDVFAAMFSAPMKEANDNIVEIKDTEPHVLKKFLKFMYTDSVKDIEIFEDASSVLALADKYNVDKLKKACEEIICAVINLSNVIDATILANHHNASHLLSFALDFVISNLKNLFETQELEKIATACPNVFVEILKKMSKSK